MSNCSDLESNETTNELYEILMKSHYVLKVKEHQEEEVPSAKIKLEKLKPSLSDVKESIEFIVSASELFGIIGSLFAI